MKTIKAEEVYISGYETFADVTARLPRFIEHVYNAKRMHSALGYVSPNNFEAQLAQLAAYTEVSNLNDTFKLALHWRDSKFVVLNTDF